MGCVLSRPLPTFNIGPGPAAQPRQMQHLHLSPAPARASEPTSTQRALDSTLLGAAQPASASHVEGVESDPVLDEQIATRAAEIAALRAKIDAEAEIEARAEQAGWGGTPAAAVAAVNVGGTMSVARRPQRPMSPAQVSTALLCNRSTQRWHIGLGIRN
jgi:hypothetical protein